MELQLMKTYALLQKLNEMTQNKLLDKKALEEQFENIKDFEDDFLQFITQLNESRLLELTDIDEVVKYMILLHLKFDKLKWYLDEMHEMVRDAAGNYRDSMEAERKINRLDDVKEQSKKKQNIKEIKLDHRVRGFDFERFVLQYEQQALIAAGKPELATRVALGSSFHEVGYDILSFDEDGKNKYIECKVTKSKDLKGLRVTQNQLNLGLEYWDQYYFYILNSEDKLTIIRNPYKAILDNADVVPYYHVSFAIPTDDMNT
ncbi:DUF3883 domain-containing protein [Bacillus cereus]|uniref:DUF3883 domain-containing protein n=1 Tax=Bacillus cereus TaxID=1396 RepID=UPI003D026207